ncbi:putative polysaccharide biosynthesis protein [Bacillus changyiensis]|uniref:putative polysaccharide biosynthesis protein n=1 Tax=Bacillus changyiensis TaxID=3004103 RepID=UPI0022E98F71|nr:polysaccharide biosynthesis protein [Bacillus changyiensis]MDA1478213.1 polysaccharide biosynthesis protein [Bacillus changyiensis]
MRTLSEQKRQLWQGAFVLSLAGIFSKVLSAGYRVPFQNIVGDVGFYIYQQVYPLLGISVVLVTVGFPVTISKIMNDYEVENRAKILRISMMFLSGIGLSCFLILFAGAKGIAWLMGDPDLEQVIRAVSFSYLLLPFISFFRGYFQGRQWMVPTAFSQMGEQLVRVTVILLLTWWLVKQGFSLYDTGAGAAFASFVGGLTAFIILAKFWVTRDRRHRSEVSNLNTKTVIKQLSFYTLTICVSSLMLILIQLVDAFNLYSLLLDHGLDKLEAKHIKGVYDRGQPLLQLGTVFAVSVATALVPTLTKARKQQETNLQLKVQYAMKTSLTLGIGAAVGLICILDPVNMMLFKNSEGTAALQIFSLSIFFASLAMTITAVLQGFGHPFFPAVSVLLGTVIKTILNVMLIPSFGIEGAALATALSFAFVALLNFLKLKRQSLTKLSDYNMSGLLISAFMMLMVLVAWLYIFEMVIDTESRWIAAFESLTGVVLGGATYLYSIIKLKVYSDEELELLPFAIHLFTFKRERGE